MKDDQGASAARLADLQRNLASFYPHLLHGYLDLVQTLGGPAVLAPRDLELLSNLVLGSQQIFVDRKTVWLAWQRRELYAYTQALTCLHDTGPLSAGVFAALYPAMSHPLDAVMQAILDYAASGVPKMDVKGRLVAWAFASPNPLDRSTILTGFGCVARQSPGIMKRLAETLDKYFTKRPLSSLKAWLTRGFSLVHSCRVEEASAYLTLQSRESRAFLGLKGALLREEQEILRIFTASRCGIGFNILSQEISAFLSPRAYTDGKSIFLPPETSVFSDNDLNRRSYSALTALIAGLISSGTYGFDLNVCEFRFELGKRYGKLIPPINPNVMLEYSGRIKAVRERRGNIIELVFKTGRPLVVLETDIERFWFKFPTPHFAAVIFTLLELSRVESALCRRYEGLRQDFERMNRAVAYLVPAQADSQGGGLEAFLAAVRHVHLLRLDAAGAVAASRAACAAGGIALRKVIGEIDRQFERIREAESSVQTSADCTFKIYNAFFEVFPVSRFAGGSEAILRWVNPLDPALEPAIVADASPELFAHHAERPMLPPGDESDIQSIDLTRNAPEKEIKETIQAEIARKAVKLFAYPEFDNDQKRYLRRHSIISERLLEPGDDTWYDTVVKTHRQLQTRMVKKFQSMQPEEVELTRRWYDGDDIHLGDAMDYAVDLLRGATGDDRIYQRKTVNVRSVALQILVDASSSTKDEVNGIPVIDMEKTALALLGSALHKIGDTFSIASYNSNGADKVNFFIAKDFSDPWTRRVRSRIDSISPWSANRDGCAIRHAVNRLSAQRQKTKILLLLSDGVPADPGYGQEDGTKTSAYALEDTRRAILEARRSGIIPFCITIDEKAKDYIGHLYGDYSYSVLSDINFLPQRLARLYVRLTK